MLSSRRQAIQENILKSFSRLTLRVRVGVYTYLIIGAIVHCNYLLHAVCGCGLVCHRLDVAPSHEAMDRTTDLLGCCDGAQGAMVQLALLLLEDGEGRGEPAECGGAEERNGGCGALRDSPPQLVCCYSPCCAKHLERCRTASVTSSATESGERRETGRIGLTRTAWVSRNRHSIGWRRAIRH